MADIDIALVILEQLGGNKFKVMTGAKDFLAIGNGCQFSIPGKGFAKNNINKVRIVLNDSDTYDIDFWRITKTKSVLVVSVKDIYCDNLQNVFTEMTGLSTHL